MLNKKQNINHKLLLTNIQNDKERKQIIKKLMEKSNFGNIESEAGLLKLNALLADGNNILTITQFKDAIKKVAGQKEGDKITNVMAHLFIEKFLETLEWKRVKKLIIFELIREAINMSKADFAKKAGQHIRAKRHQQVSFFDFSGLI